MLETIKKALGITGNYLDDTIQIYIDEVNSYLVSSGMPSDLVNTDETVGI